MQGSIEVYEVVRREQRLKDWRARAQRDAEWEALKQWWSAERKVRRAQSRAARLRAKLELAKTAWLYRRELRRAWPKWRRARLARWHGINLEVD